jgi:hypothetical protein
MPKRVDGRIIGIAAGHDSTDVVLDNDPAVGPLKNTVGLQNGHDNYNALYSLVLAAAANRWVVTIGTEEEIDPNLVANAKFVQVKWP